MSETIMNSLEKARKILHENNYTFVLLNDNNTIFTSHKKGIMPLMEIIQREKYILDDAVIADKVIGKAAALLISGFKVKGLYTDLMSQKAKEILELFSIEHQCEALVDYIQNRAKDDQCPMEKLTKDIFDYQTAYQKILDYYKEVLNINFKEIPI
jgi:tyrosine-protein phosphatase YwqE